ncbi:hypothetical protein ACP70R_026307 [Stipagrostis hirtigluma subsp. patula]
MASLLAVVAAFAASCALLAASVSSMPPVVFEVGEERGWAVPSGNGTESYNHWAKRTRFQVGDVLHFKYTNDSVVLVGHDEYKQCSTETALGRFTGGDTRFTFDRAGPFYFVSGVPGHCEAGQRMIVRVTASSVLTGHAPAAAPGMPPTAGGGSGSVRRGAPSPAMAPRAGVPSGSSASSPSPSPQPESSGASRRGITSSVAVGLLVAVIAMFVVV